MKFPGRILSAAKDATVYDYTFDRDGKVTDSTPRTVASTQCWTVNLDGKRHWVGSDDFGKLQTALDHNGADDPTDMTGFICKLNPQTGNISYGPKRITRAAARRIIAFATADR